MWISKFIKLILYKKIQFKEIFSKTYNKKIIKNKKRILKTAREKKLINLQVTPPPIKLSLDFSAITLQASRRKWDDIYKELKGWGGGKPWQSKLVYLADYP